MSAQPPVHPAPDVDGDESTPESALDLPATRPLDLASTVTHEAGELPNLGGRAVRGILISTGFAVAWEVAGGVATLITARFLLPEDYALFGVAVFALGIGGALVAFSLDTRLVQVPEDPGDAFDYGFTLQLATSAVYIGLALLIAPVASKLYGNGALVPICLVLSLQRLIGTFGWPGIYFQRELLWWKQRLIGSAGPAIQIVLTLVLAIRGFGVWSLVYGQVAGTVVPTALTWALASRRPRIRLPIPRRYLSFFFKFAWPLWVGGLVSIAAINGMMKEVDLTLGLAMLGYIRMAVALGERIDRAEHILGTVLFPVLSRTRDPARLRRAFALSQKAVLIWSVPTGLGLAVFANDIVYLFLGDKWLPIVPLLRVEGIGEVLNAIATMWEMFYMVKGDNRPGMRLGLQINLFMLLVIGVASATFGYGGVVVTIFLAVLIGLYQRRRYTLKMFPGMPVILTAFPLLLAGVTASVMTLLLTRSIAAMAYLPRLSLRLALFLGLYAVLVVALERPFLREGWTIFRQRRFTDESAEGGLA